MKNKVSIIFILMVMLGLFISPAFGTSTTQKIEIFVGESFELKPFMVSNGSLKQGTPAWKSQNAGVASVTGAGSVKGLKPGTTLISATVNQGNGIKEAKVQVVVKTMVQSVAINETDVKIASGQNFNLKATITSIPGFKEPLLNGVEWKTQDPSVVKVDASGVLTGLNPGKVIVYASTKDGDKRAYVNVEVVSQVKSLTVSPRELKMKMGDTAQLVTTVLPEDAFFKAVLYKSGTPTVATVDNNGYVVAKSVGTSVLTVTTVDAGRSFAVVVTVESMVKAVTLNKTYLNLNDVNHTEQLTASLVPAVEGAMPKESGVKWVSSNAAIATVSDTGLVKALRSGLVTITATSLDGGFQAACTVDAKIANAANDKIQISGIKLVNPPKVVYTGEEVPINYEIYPENATDRTVNARADLTTANVTISVDGKLIFKPTFPATYQLTIFSGDVSTVTTIEVKDSVKSLKVVPRTLTAVQGGYAVYLGHEATLDLVYELTGIENSQFTNSDIVWNYNNTELKVDKVGNNPGEVKIKLLKPINTYIEGSMLKGSKKFRINLFYEPTAKSMEITDQAIINLNYLFKPVFKLQAKEGLRYGVTEVLDTGYDLFVEESYISTAFLKSEIAYETENLPLLKKKADEAATDAEKDKLLAEWGKHSLRKYHFENWIVDGSAMYQKVKDMSILTDRSLNKLDFFTIKDKGILSVFDGKALIRVVSSDGGLEKKIWVTAKEQSEDLILMDQYGNVVATSSELVKEQIKAQELVKYKERLAALKASFKKTPTDKLPSEAFLEGVQNAIKAGLVTEESFSGKYVKVATKSDLAMLLVKAYEVETKKTLKNLTTYYYSDLKNQFAEKAYQLGLFSGNSKRIFSGNTVITANALEEAITKWEKATKKKIDNRKAITSLIGTKASFTNEELIEIVYLLLLNTN